MLHRRETLSRGRPIRNRAVSKAARHLLRQEPPLRGKDLLRQLRKLGYKGSDRTLYRLAAAISRDIWQEQHRPASHDGGEASRTSASPVEGTSGPLTTCAGDGRLREWEQEWAAFGHFLRFAPCALLLPRVRLLVSELIADFVGSPLVWLPKGATLYLAERLPGHVALREVPPAGALAIVFPCSSPRKRRRSRPIPPAEGSKTIAQTLLTIVRANPDLDFGEPSTVGDMTYRDDSGKLHAAKPTATRLTDAGAMELAALAENLGGFGLQRLAEHRGMEGLRALRASVHDDVRQWGAVGLQDDVQLWTAICNELRAGNVDRVHDFLCGRSLIGRPLEGIESRLVDGLMRIAARKLAVECKDVTMIAATGQVKAWLRTATGWGGGSPSKPRSSRKPDSERPISIAARMPDFRMACVRGGVPEAAMAHLETMLPSHDGMPPQPTANASRWEPLLERSVIDALDDLARSRSLRLILKATPKLNAQCKGYVEFWAAEHKLFRTAVARTVQSLSAGGTPPAAKAVVIRFRLEALAAYHDDMVRKREMWQRLAEGARRRLPPDASPRPGPETAPSVPKNWPARGVASGAQALFPGVFPFKLEVVAGDSMLPSKSAILSAWRRGTPEPSTAVRMWVCRFPHHDFPSMWLHLHRRILAFLKQSTAEKRMDG